MLTRIDDHRSPFHASERAVQEKLGVREIETWARQVVRDHLPEQHRAFHTSLPFLIAAARDEHGRPWATVLTGPENFVTSPDPRSLHIDARPAPGDALQRAFVPGADVGILGIELASRRRNRVNGRIGSDGRTLLVDQTFGNCPQYIRDRALRRVAPGVLRAPRRGTQLTVGQQSLVAAADTFFIASGFRGDGDDPAFGMDASHRGGERGLVEVLDAGHLRFPDYAGNNHYNTVGNLLADPRAGFLFVDFATGSLLQITGRATVDWEPDVKRFPGARLLVTLEIDAVVEQPSVLPLRWNVDAASVRSLRLIEKRPESADVTSFLFEARDGGPLPSFAGGQHLPIEFFMPGRPEPVQRTYSLSDAAHDAHYRISVKRLPKGLASTFLHDHLEPGAIIECRRPAGDFLLPADGAPVVLVSAGVGVTPMVGMLHDLVARGDPRPILFVHGARDGRHHPFADEVRELADENANIAIHTAYSHPDPTDEPGRDYDRHRRVSADLLAELGAGPDAHYLICGPVGFMAELTGGLADGGIPAGRIHTETF